MPRRSIRKDFQRWLALLLIIIHLILPSSGFAHISSLRTNPSSLRAKIMSRSALPPHPHDPSYNGQRPIKLRKDSASPSSHSKEVIASIKRFIAKPATLFKGRSGRMSEAQRRNLAALMTNQSGEKAFQVRFNNQSATPAMVKLKTPKHIAGLTSQNDSGAKDAARNFLRENRDLLGLIDPDVELQLKRQWLDSRGNRHLRYQQTAAGIPIWGREALVHMDSTQAVYLYQGRTEKTYRVHPRPVAKISAAQAIATAERHLGKNAQKAVAPTTELTYYPAGNALILCYRVDLQASTENRWWYLIDACDGCVVHRVSRIASDVVTGSGTDLLGIPQSFNAWSEENVYYLVDPTIPLDDPPYNPVTSSEPKGNLYVLDARHGESDLYYITSMLATAGWDPAGVSAMHNVATVYDYYKNTHGRDGIDDKGMNYLAIVHLGQNLVRAFWNGSQIVFGDGDGKTFSNLAASLDVVAHEIQHGVTEYTAGLLYENQSGALNEAYSDIFACMVDRDDWTSGEDITLVEPGFARDVAHPENGLDPLPSKMSEYQNLPNTEDGDFGGVHINMGIPSRAAYLIAEGLSKEGLGTSIGRNKTEAIFYCALTTYLMASSNFADGRNATLQAAEDLYGANSAEVAAVQSGWDAVEVYGDDGSVPTDPGPTPADPVQGDDLMVYLHPEDGSFDSSSENFDVHVQRLPDPFTGYDSNQVSPKLNSTLYAACTRPAVYSDGEKTRILYVGADYNVYSVYADNSGHEQLTTSGDFWSIALSPDGRYIAYTTTSSSDNTIYVFDSNTEITMPYPVVPSTTQNPGDSTVFNTILWADALAFDYTGKRIVFDALNCLSTSDSACADGEGYRYWSIGILDISDGSFLFPFPNQSPDYDRAYPAFAANNSYVVTLDLIDKTQESTNGTISSAVCTFNWKDGTSQVVDSPSPFKVVLLLFSICKYFSS